MHGATTINTNFLKTLIFSFSLHSSLLFFHHLPSFSYQQKILNFFFHFFYCFYQILVLTLKNLSLSVSPRFLRCVNHHLFFLFLRSTYAGINAEDDQLNIIH